jgi:hypothetical protein
MYSPCRVLEVLPDDGGVLLEPPCGAGFLSEFLLSEFLLSEFLLSEISLVRNFSLLSPVNCVRFTVL